MGSWDGIAGTQRRGDLGHREATPQGPAPPDCLSPSPRPQLLPGAPAVPAAPPTEPPGPFPAAAGRSFVETRALNPCLDLLCPPVRLVPPSPLCVAGKPRHRRAGTQRPHTGGAHASARMTSSPGVRLVATRSSCQPSGPAETGRPGHSKRSTNLRGRWWRRAAGQRDGLRGSRTGPAHWRGHSLTDTHGVSADCIPLAGNDGEPDGRAGAENSTHVIKKAEQTEGARRPRGFISFRRTGSVGGTAGGPRIEPFLHWVGARLGDPGWRGAGPPPPRAGRRLANSQEQKESTEIPFPPSFGPKTHNDFSRKIKTEKKALESRRARLPRGWRP